MLNAQPATNRKGVTDTTLFIFRSKNINIGNITQGKSESVQINTTNAIVVRYEDPYFPYFIHLYGNLEKRAVKRSQPLKNTRKKANF